MKTKGIFKRKGLKRAVGLLSALAMVVGVFGSVLTPPVSACNTIAAQIAVNTFYNRAYLRFNIQDSALTPSFAQVASYRLRALWSQSEGGWNDIDRRVKMVEVEKNLTGANIVQVKGQSIPANAQGGLTLGIFAVTVTGSTWSNPIITMNTNAAAWTGMGATEFYKTFLHEVGHCLNLLDVSCMAVMTNYCGNSVMRQGYPGGVVSSKVSTSDADRVRRSR
ncbi:MAG: hypothetical protein FWG45_01680 [Oscillospiraceae bacterium]|nr:hypothetical protein [Oscillospiraceae bacterium]